MRIKLGEKSGYTIWKVVPKSFPHPDFSFYNITMHLIFGPSKTGKSLVSLKVADDISNEFNSKVLVIDTEGSMLQMLLAHQEDFSDINKFEVITIADAFELMEYFGYSLYVGAEKEDEQKKNPKLLVTWTKSGISKIDQILSKMPKYSVIILDSLSALEEDIIPVSSSVVGPARSSLYAKILKEVYKRVLKYNLFEISVTHSRSRGAHSYGIQFEPKGGEAVKKYHKVRFMMFRDESAEYIKVFVTRNVDYDEVRDNMLIGSFKIGSGIIEDAVFGDLAALTNPGIIKDALRWIREIMRAYNGNMFSKSDALNVRPEDVNISWEQLKKTGFIVRAQGIKYVINTEKVKEYLRKVKRT